MSMASCLYEGVVRHRRMDPPNEFRHHVAMAYIDLDELPTLLNGRLLARGPGLARFRRADYHGDPAVPLGRAVRDSVFLKSGRRVEGPIRVLTNLRSFGHCFNPVSFYYCFDLSGERLEAVLAEVTNTPWGERHSYVITEGVGSFEKAMHVSPFMAMDYVYNCRSAPPGGQLTVSIDSSRRGTKAFEASLVLQRRPLTAASLRSVSRRYPLATLRILALIYGHAVGLKLAGARIHPHPRRSEA